MKKFYTLLLFTISLTVFNFCSCVKSGSKSGGAGSNETTEENTPSMRVNSPFSPDSAYMHVARQVSFGPRVPNTKGHDKCGDYLEETLRGLGLEVTVQKMDLTAYDGTTLKSRNIIASSHPEREKRILLYAHWDTRPVADYDPDPAKREDPIDGADDGASGTGVLLELARLLTLEPLQNYGVDILLLDAEDYGVPHEEGVFRDTENSWALGAQYFAKNPHKAGYRAEFGILLDMVGAKGATFYREFFSQERAGKLTTYIWKKAEQMGYGHYFINKMGGAITDDHVFIMRGLGIPSVDIINYKPDTQKGFGDYWHTHKDNLDIIDKATLQAVGEVVWEVLKSKDAEANK